MDGGELFVDGQPPDFSVLPELLCPPCLESEPCNSSSSSSSLAPNPGGGGPEATVARRSRWEPLSGMTCCLQTPDNRALNFLQESAQLLAQHDLISSSTTGRPQRQGSLTVRTRRSATAHQSDCFTPALASFGTLDALSLITLHCSNLESEPVNGTEPSEAMQERFPSAASKDLSGNHLGKACIKDPSVAQREFEWQLSRSISRKQLKPRRSCEALDPAFQGVTFQMQLSLRQSNSEDCPLLISPQYSRNRKKRSRVPLARQERRVGSSKEEQRWLSTHRNKRCASCKTTRTPLWREAEDGTLLCNACGIRYKKYRIRCFQCWTIPKHGGKIYLSCSNCGGKFHVAAAQKTIW